MSIGVRMHIAALTGLPLLSFSVVCPLLLTSFIPMHCTCSESSFIIPARRDELVDSKVDVNLCEVGEDLEM